MMNSTLKISLFLILLGVPGFPAAADSWDELNAQRANVGLPPLIQNADLMRFAQAKAEWQAARHVSGFVPSGPDNYAIRRDHRGRPYNGHEGPRIPGVVEGTGCGRIPGPYITCAWDAKGALEAGTGVAIGSDGFRYMVTMIRAHRTIEANRNVPLINTSHLTPNAPRVPRRGSIPADPSVAHVPTRYVFDGKVSVDVGRVSVRVGALQRIPCPRCGRIH